MFCQVCHIYCHFQDKEAYSQIPSCENASGAKKERWLEYEDTLWKRKKKVIMVIQTFFLPSQYVKIHVQQILAWERIEENVSSSGIKQYTAEA